MTNLLKHHPYLSARLEAVLRNHKIPEDEAEAIMDDVDAGLSDRGTGYFGEGGHTMSFFEKPLKRRIQIVLEAFLTATLMAVAVALVIWKLTN